MADVGPIRGRRFGRMYWRFERYASVRHKRLLIAGLCRCAINDLPEMARAAIETLERVADGLEPASRLDEEFETLVSEVARLREDHSDRTVPIGIPEDPAWLAAQAAPRLSPWSARQVRILRTISGALQSAAPNSPDIWHPFVGLRGLSYETDTDVLGPSFPPPDEMRGRLTRVLLDLSVAALGPISFDPRWRTADVVGIARAIYEDRAWDGMPLLADALMDAGCGRARIIDHCREPGPHYRGCWVVDAVLGL